MAEFPKFAMQDSNLWKATKSADEFADLSNASAFVQFAVKDSEKSHLRGTRHFWGGVQNNQVEEKAGKPEVTKEEKKPEVKEEKVTKETPVPKSSPVVETDSEFVKFALKDSENSHLKLVPNFGQDNCKEMYDRSSKAVFTKAFNQEN